MRLSGLIWGSDGLAVGREYAEMHPGMTLDHRQGKQSVGTEVLANKKMYGSML